MILVIEKEKTSIVKTLDAIDWRILRLLQEDAKYTNKEIAARLGMTTTPVYERIKRLEENGYVRGYVALLNRERLGLHMLAFCLGGILFYYLLYKSGVVPRWLSLWGLITVSPLLIATLLSLFEYEAPAIVALPYIPFEFVIGIWILVKGTTKRD